MKNLVDKIAEWHWDRNLIAGSTDAQQFVKLTEEVGELAGNIARGREGHALADDIGDICVVLINLAERNDLSLEDCLEKAWDDIKDRKGRMVDGIFVKEAE